MNPLDLHNQNTGKTINERIQWSMAHARLPLKRYCTDKIKCKQYIKDKLGEGFTAKLLASADNVHTLRSIISKSQNHPNNFILKANNDSGGTTFIKDKKISKDQQSLIEKYKNNIYEGFFQGEWFYSGIEYKCFSEELLGNNLTDYKFHCAGGEPRFVDIIHNRYEGQRHEVHVDLEGNCFDFLLQDACKLSKHFDKPKNWELMKMIAQVLCQDFDYVRVDLFNTDISDISHKSLFVSELTFAPMRGNYVGSGQIKAGRLIS